MKKISILSFLISTLLIWGCNDIKDMTPPDKHIIDFKEEIKTEYESEFIDNLVDRIPSNFTVDKAKYGNLMTTIKPCSKEEQNDSKDKKERLMKCQTTMQIFSKKDYGNITKYMNRMQGWETATVYYKKDTVIAYTPEAVKMINSMNEKVYSIHYDDEIIIIRTFFPILSQDIETSKEAQKIMDLYKKIILEDTTKDNPQKENDKNKQKAEETLISFFDNLSTKEYKKAIDIFEPQEGYPTENLNWNNFCLHFMGEANCEKDDLIKNYCEATNTCLKVNILNSEKISKEEYKFKIQFRQEDGKVFVKGPCCGATEETMPSINTFEYKVKLINNSWKVTTTPIWKP